MSERRYVPYTNPDGKVEQVLGTVMDTIESKDAWSEFILSDGAKIKLKPVLVNVVRVDGKQNSNQEQVYAVHSETVMDIVPKIE